jgi:hypothetical protein
MLLQLLSLCESKECGKMLLIDINNIENEEKIDCGKTYCVVK